MPLSLLARRREPYAVRRRAASRAGEVQAALDLASAGFLLLAGNSHAEAAGLALPPSVPAVNAGVCGLCAPCCARLLGGLRFTQPPASAILFLGNNEIRRDWHPLSAGALRRFGAAVHASISHLRAAGAGRIMLAAVSPLGPAALAQRDPAAVAVYNAQLRHLAELTGAVWFDPFAGVCTDGGGISLTGLAADGLHLADYRAMLPALDVPERQVPLQGYSVDKRRVEAAAHRDGQGVPKGHGNRERATPALGR